MVLPLTEILQSTVGIDSVGKVMLWNLLSESCNQTGSNFIPSHSVKCYSTITNVFYNKLTVASVIVKHCEIYIECVCIACMSVYICIYNIKEVQMILGLPVHKEFQIMRQNLNGLSSGFKLP